MSSLDWTRPFAASVFAALLAAAPAASQLPDAGTRIVNQANVQYVDATNIARETTTNEVVLLVRPVYNATLGSDQSRLGVAGGTVRFSHVLSNAGNTANTFCVDASQIAGDSGNYDAISVVWDVNNDGVADANEAVLFDLAAGAGVTLALERDASASLLVSGTLPSGATVGQTFGLDLNVSSQDGSGACAAGLPMDIGANADGLNGTNRDIASITDGPVLELTKSSTYFAGVAGDLSDDMIDYVLTLRNTGSQEATDILVSDTLPAGVSFAAFGLHEGLGGAVPSHLNGDVTLTMAALNSGQTAIVRFTVDVDALLGFAGEDREILNTATVEANLDGVPGREPAIESNRVRDLVPAVTGVTLSDTGTGAAAGVNNGGDDDGAVNDVQRIDVAAPGETAVFALRVTNTGNVSDTFNLTPNSRSGWLSTGGLRFVNSDRTTPLLDTNSDGIPDTGPLAPGETLVFYVRAALTTTVPAGPHSAEILAVSTWPIPSSATAASDPAGLLIGGVQAPSVDIANSAGATGFADAGSVDADPASSVTTTLNAAPGGQVMFDLFIANEGGGRDTFALSAAASQDGSTPLPAGWTVEFTRLDGTVLSSTPSLAAGAVFAFHATVSVPPSAGDGSVQAVFFAAASPLTGVRDVKQDAVAISGAPAIVLTPDGSGQVEACANTDYLHTLRNTGGTVETVVISRLSQSQLSSQVRLPTSIFAGDPSGFTALPLLSTAQSVAVLSGGVWVMRPLVSDGAGGVAVGLAPGEETRVEVRVSAACSAASGLVDVLILRAQTLDLDAESQVTDITRVGSNMLRIRKYGALDPNCAGSMPASFDDARVLAQPGDCVVWQIRLENTGADPVCDVRALDSAPAFTQLSAAPLIFSQPTPGTGLCTVSGQEFTCSIGNTLDADGDGNNESHCLRGGETAEVRFSVEVE